MASAGVAPISRMNTDALSSDQDDEKIRYLQFECSYHANTRKGWTWGELVKKDYDHFVYLMANHVPLDSKTYTVLREELLPPDRVYCDRSVRFQDTDAGKEKQRSERGILK